MNKGKLAKDYFMQGYNCSQSVCLAFSEELDMDTDTVAKAVSAFGGGMGRMREVCGAVSGMCFVLSMLQGYSDPKDNEKKAALYGKMQQLADEFKNRNHSIICRELLNGIIPKETESHIPEERTSQYYKKRPCADMVSDAADILEEYLF